MHMSVFHINVLLVFIFLCFYADVELIRPRQKVASDLLSISKLKSWIRHKKRFEDICFRGETPSALWSAVAGKSVSVHQLL